MTGKDLKKTTDPLKEIIAKKDRQIIALKMKTVEKQTKLRGDLYDKACEKSERQRLNTYLDLRGKGWLKKDKVRIEKIKTRKFKAALQILVRKQNPNNFKINPEDFGLFGLKVLWKYSNFFGKKSGLPLISYREFQNKVKLANVPKIPSAGRAPARYTMGAIALVFPEHWADFFKPKQPGILEELFPSNPSNAI